jgi:hypothetical protein
MEVIKKKQDKLERKLKRLIEIHRGWLYLLVGNTYTHFVSEDTGKMTYLKQYSSFAVLFPKLQT